MTSATADGVSGAEAEPNVGESRPRYRRDIDGLRAIAVTGVVLFHAGIPGFKSGFVGVDVFFVISGFLIGGIILRGARRGAFSFADFYSRRARRIVPALVLVLCVATLVGGAILSGAEFKNFSSTLGAAILGVSNIELWKEVNYFAPQASLNPLLMTWSLGVEEQFYLVFPWLILLFAKRSRAFILAVLAATTLFSFLLSLWGTTHAPSAAFYLLPYRAWELAVGAILSVLVTPSADFSDQAPNPLAKGVQEALGWGGLAMTLGSLFVFNSQTPFPGWAAIVPVAGTAALISSERSFVNQRLLSAKPAVFIGLISYSWYLWHWPLIAYVKIASTLPPPAWAPPAAAASAFLLAYLSWRFVEQPFRKMRLAPAPVLLRYAGVIVAVGLVAAVIRFGHGLPQRVPIEAARIDQIVQGFQHDPCLTNFGEKRPNRSAKCVSTIPTDAPIIAVIGDSHAAALGPGVQDMAKSLGYRSEVLAKSACRPLSGVTVWQRKYPQLPAECAAFMDSVAASAASDPQVKIVLLVGMWDGPLQDPGQERYVASHGGPGGQASAEALLRSGLQTMIATLQKSGKQIILVGDTPWWRFDPAAVAQTEAIPIRLMVADALLGGLDTTGAGVAHAVVPHDQSIDRMLVQLAQQDHIGYLDLYSRFCDLSRCRFREGSTLWFADPSHLSPAGAGYALQGVSLTGAASAVAQP